MTKKTGTKPKIVSGRFTVHMSNGDMMDVVVRNRRITECSGMFHEATNRQKIQAMRVVKDALGVTP